MVKRIISKGKGNRSRFTIDKIQKTELNLINKRYTIEKAREAAEIMNRLNNTPRAERMRKRNDQTTYMFSQKPAASPKKPDSINLPKKVSLQDVPSHKILYTVPETSNESSSY